MLKRAPRSLAVFATATVALAAAATFAAVTAQSDLQPKFPPNPWAGKSDAERQADVDAAHKRNDEYLREFIASGNDPRSLPVVEIAAYAKPLPDLPSAVEAADVVVRGVVEETTFEINPSGGLPIMRSSVRIATTGKGGLGGGSVVVVRQLGGPVAQPDGGAFARLDNDEPILPGDEVVLFLQRASDGAYAPQPGTGVYFIKEGRTYAEEANPFGEQVSGRTPDWLTSALDSLSQ